MIDPEFQQFKERVRSLVPIEQIVGERVASLKRAGNSWKACCPFHQERTPSFVVSPERGTWHCFGACGTGGDVFDFLMRFDGVAFPEALEQLAARVGLEAPRRAASAGLRPDHQPLWDCLADVGSLWQRELRGPHGAAALGYVRARGLQDATIDAFGLGYARAGALRDLARARGWDAALLERVGLLRRSDDGRYFEFFRDRLSIPIRDRDGHVVGFGARVLEAGAAAKGPKYLNSGETELFHKGRLIYGLDRALPTLRRARHAILVEGYTDVMAFHQAGISNALAVLGSALTDDHAALLRRTGATRITCCFDGDEAGRKATWRALHGLLPLPFTVDVAIPPEGMDPGDYLAAGRGGELVALLSAPRDWMEVLCEPLAGLPTGALAEKVGEIVALVARIRDAVLRDARLVELARRSGLSVESVRDRMQVQLARPRAAALEATRTRVTAEIERSGATLGERAERLAWQSLIGVCMADNSLVPQYSTLLSACPSADLAEVARLLLEIHGRASDLEPIDAARLLRELRPDHALRGELLVWESEAQRAESSLDVAESQARLLRRYDVERQRSALHRRAGDLDAADLMQITRELQKTCVPAKAEHHHG